MKALDLKLLRDLWNARAQAFGVCVVLAVATWTFILANGAYQSLSDTRDSYYDRNSFADVFVSMTRAQRSIVAKAASIKGVQRAEGTIRQYATLDLPNRDVPARALVTSVKENVGNRLNRITLQSGRLPRAGATSEIVIDEAFAQANSLGPGDQINTIIYGSRHRLDVVGIGLSPEFIFAMGPGDLLPDERRFGIFWMGEKALEAVTDRTEAINYLSLKLDHGASEADVIREVDLLVSAFGATGAHGRDSHLSHAFISNELDQLKAITSVIPPVFLLVAAFLVYVVISRIIRTERTQIGLLKATGYSDWSIGWHYLKFTLIIAGLGAALGSVAGVWIGRDVTSFYANLYRFPFFQYELSLSVLLTAAGMSVGAALLGAFVGVRAAVRLEPAVAMAPQAPAAYRPGPIEALGRRAGFTPIGNMIVRHIVRWPLRSAMTVQGVALSIGLLFSTLQFVDSARVMVDSSFVRAQRQDMSVMFIEPRNEDVIYALAQLPGVLRAEPSRSAVVKIRKGHLEERVMLLGVADDAQLSARIHRDGPEVRMPKNGLMLSQHLASKIGAKTGDRVEVELLGGKQTLATMAVTGVVEEFFAEQAYVSENALERITKDASPVGSALLRIDANERVRLLDRFKDMPNVLGVVERDAAITKFEQLIDENILTLISVFAVFAGAVTAGVVYNSARILLAERVHDLAILRVLGFHRREVVLVLLGELALLVAIAVPLGCVLGHFIAQYMTSMFTSDLFRLPYAPARSTFAYAVLICLGSALLSALIVARRILRLDTVKVLQS